MFSDSDKTAVWLCIAGVFVYGLAVAWGLS